MGSKEKRGDAGRTKVSIDQALALLKSRDTVGLEERLRESPALATERGEGADTLLHWACHHKSLKAVELLLKNGADPNARGFNGRSPLHAAVNDTSAERALPVVRALLDYGAVPSIQDDAGFDAVEWARQEVWAPNDEVLAVLGASRPPSETPRARGDYAETRALIRSIESRAHTELGVVATMEAYLAGESLPTEALYPGAARRALEELRALLLALDGTVWREPVRELLAEHLKPAQIRRLVSRYWETLDRPLE